MRRIATRALLLLGTAAFACAPPTVAPRADVPAAWAFPRLEEAVAPSAMVASDAPLATRVGVEMLRNGGNAVDAAVATAFALAVVYPEAGNLGGGGFMVAHLADGRNIALDFREAAPRAASRDMYLDSTGNVSVDRSLIGHLASGVPGAVAGLYAAHQRHGKRPWADVLEPAIRLAEDGFVVDANFEGAITDAAERLRRFPASAALFLPDGRAPAAGSRWRNPELALVLRRIAARGPAGFYEGETADAIVRELQRGGGLITHEDLRAYRAEWREPIEFDYRGHHIVSMPPSSSGGVTLALLANILDGYPLASLGWHSPVALHLTAEALRRAFADRNHFLGDPAFVTMPLARLVSQGYADTLRAGIDDRHATPSAQVRPGNGEVVEGEHTTHFSVVDAAGNAVALTTTINELFGSAVTVAGAGFLLNDEMDDFTSKPGVPNMFGLVQGEANAIAPGKRMLSAMTPTIVLDEQGAPMLVTGARGGPRIITAVFQVLSNIVDYDMSASDAVRLPRIHHQHLPDVLYYEPNGLTSAQVAALRALGHDVQSRDGYVGTAPTLLRREGAWHGVADPRTGGLAAGY